MHEHSSHGDTDIVEFPSATEGLPDSCRHEGDVDATVHWQRTAAGELLECALAMERRGGTHGHARATSATKTPQNRRVANRRGVPTFRRVARKAAVMPAGDLGETQIVSNDVRRSSYVPRACATAPRAA
jgi:hypothetical protein